MMVDIDLALFTPTDRHPTDLIPTDRPYATVLTVGVGYNARGQSAAHFATSRGLGRPLGAPPQSAERLASGDRRRPLRRLEQPAARRTDRATRAGAARQSGGADPRPRLGWHLPDDIGSAPLRPAGEKTSPRAAGAEPGWAGHAFATVNARWVLRDLTLDGNTLKNSHRVDKEPLVADLGYGVVLTSGPWKLAFARYHRTREFRVQQDVPVCGSVTLSRRFE